MPRLLLPGSRLTSEAAKEVSLNLAVANPNDWTWFVQFVKATDREVQSFRALKRREKRHLKKEERYKLERRRKLENLSGILGELAKQLSPTGERTESMLKDVRDRFEEVKVFISDETSILRGNQARKSGTEIDQDLSDGDTTSTGEEDAADNDTEKEAETDTDVDTKDAARPNGLAEPPRNETNGAAVGGMEDEAEGRVAEEMNQDGEQDNNAEKGVQEEPAKTETAPPQDDSEALRRTYPSKYNVDFHPYLKVVSIPNLDKVRSQPCAAQISNLRGIEVLCILDWLRLVKGVRKILTLRVLDSRYQPHSEQTIERAICRLGVEELDWKRQDVSARMVRKAAKSAHTLHLYASGAWTPLYHWIGEQGVTVTVSFSSMHHWLEQDWLSNDSHADGHAFAH